MPPWKDDQWVNPTPEDVSLVKRSLAEETSLRISPTIRRKLQHDIKELINLSAGETYKAAVYNSNKFLMDKIKLLQERGQEPVDIILPVHNALEITSECIRVLYERTSWPFHLIVVDDSSDLVIQDRLKDLASKYGFTLLVNRKNRGFSASVNRGMRAGTNPYILLLNSDVLVTPDWLTKMMIALLSNDKHQIVNPVTNNTALINVPITPGCSYLDMNVALERYSPRAYPEIMPTGFCFLFRRELTDQIGYLDESFRNYGEESDYWMRTITKTSGTLYQKYKAVLADDTYVFHQRGASFSSLGAEEEARLRSLASGRFNEYWPMWRDWNNGFDVEGTLTNLREPLSKSVVDEVKPTSKRVCWVVHSTGVCGGMKYIADIVNKINEDGGDARVALIKRQTEQAVDVVGELRSAPYIFEGYADFLQNFTSTAFDSGTVVASTVELSFVVNELASQNMDIKPILHAQSYEPMIAPNAQVRKTMEKGYALIPDVACSSSWISEILRSKKIAPFSCVPPGVDQKLFFSDGNERARGDDRPTLMLSLRKDLPVRGYDRGVQVANKLLERSQKEGVELRIMAYGVRRVPESQGIISLGSIPQSRLSKLLREEVDVFLDPSTLHSYGMPALEALSSGCAIASWDNKGIKEYITHSSMAKVLPKKTSVDSMADAIWELLTDKETRSKYQAYNNSKVQGALEIHDRKKSVDLFISDLYSHLGWEKKNLKIGVVTPHLRKFGGPTTIVSVAEGLKERGYDVFLASSYPDVSPEVAKDIDVPIYLLDMKAENLPECDVVITNSDNPLNAPLSKLPQAGKKIMLKLSHNPRFKELEEQGLQLPWDSIVTSSKWLEDICTNPSPGWNYSSRIATRIGWWHYDHEAMKFEPSERYFKHINQDKMNIGTLIHAHPSKGTQDALEVLQQIRMKYGSKIRIFGVGEIPPKKLQLPKEIRYVYSPNRRQMREFLKGIDIWLGASHTEGLGRMALEAMSASVACVLTDTGAEFAKNRETCLVVPVGDKLAMANSVDELIQNIEMREKIVTGGYAVAEVASNPDPVIDNLESIINKVTRGKKSEDQSS